MSTGRDFFGFFPIEGRIGGKCNAAWCGAIATVQMDASQVRQYAACAEHAVCGCGQPACELRGSHVGNTAHFVCGQCGR